MHDHQEITTEALLKHMAEHNKSHLAELKHVSEELTGEAGAALVRAIELYEKGNESLAEAIELL